MHSVVIFAAQYLLYVMAAVAALVWLVGSRPEKAAWAVQAVLGLLLVGVGILLASHLHSDPRPFVHDPNSAPLFPHAADNGFPSDHSAAAGLLAALVVRWRWTVGAGVAVGAAVVAWSRVAAHVHHAQDVVAGLAIGAAAAAVAIWAFGRLMEMVRHRELLSGRGGRTTADRQGRAA